MRTHAATSVANVTFLPTANLPPFPRRRRRSNLPAGVTDFEWFRFERAMEEERLRDEAAQRARAASARLAALDRAIMQKLDEMLAKYTRPTAKRSRKAKEPQA